MRFRVDPIDSDGGGLERYMFHLGGVLLHNAQDGKGALVHSNRHGHPVQH
jgi:hypothetical protein